MIDRPNAPTPARPLPAPARGIEELRPRILWTEDLWDVAHIIARANDYEVRYSQNTTTGETR